MAWRGLHISEPCHLGFGQRQVQVKRDDGQVTFPLEDIAWIILDTSQITLSARLIAEAMEANVPIIFSDGRHMPCGLALSFHQHHAQAEVAHRQASMSAPLKKRMWQKVVQQKIANQAANLHALQSGGARPLKAMASQVRSGDPSNVEARAARYYWQNFFDSFRRGADDLENACLNYGYAILRAAIARGLTASGFLPTFGIHHASKQNPFNLADDLIEPFRPIADWVAREHLRIRKIEDQTLQKEDRQALAGLLVRDVVMAGEQYTLIHSVEKTVESFKTAMLDGDAGLLVLPEGW